MTVFEYIEDFDNPELSFFDWVEQMVEAVRDYNEEFHTLHNPSTIVAQYSSMNRSNKYGDR